MATASVQSTISHAKRCFQLLVADYILLIQTKKQFILIMNPSVFHNIFLLLGNNLTNERQTFMVHSKPQVKRIQACCFTLLGGTGGSKYKFFSAKLVMVT